MKQVKFIKFLETELERCKKQILANFTKKEDDKEINSLENSLSFINDIASLKELRLITNNYKECFDFFNEKKLYNRINELQNKIEIVIEESRLKEGMS